MESRSLRSIAEHGQLGAARERNKVELTQVARVTSSRVVELSGRQDQPNLLAKEEILPHPKAPKLRSLDPVAAESCDSATPRDWDASPYRLSHEGLFPES